MSKDLLYERNGRWYADLRTRYAELVGGECRGREALKGPDGQATTDRTVATVLLARRIEELERAMEARRRGFLRGDDNATRTATLGGFAATHLEDKAGEGKVTTEWIARNEAHLRVACHYFGRARDLRSIKPRHLKLFVKHLGTLQSGRGGKLSAGTQRHHLNALSNLYRRAIEEEFAELNPVAAMNDKPAAEPREARWLDVPNATALLEAARRYESAPDEKGAPIYELIGAYLLTGGRMNEILGLTVGDVNFDGGKIHIRANEYRRVKTRSSNRIVPLWPQLREILVAYLEGEGGPSDGLLFPSSRRDGLITNFNKRLDTVAKMAGWQAGEIRSKMFRHTYCAARLQTADRIIRTLPNGNDETQWIPVSPFVVAKELGHGGRSLVDKVYGHVADSPHRSEHVEFLVEQHAKHVRARLRLVA